MQLALLHENLSESVPLAVPIETHFARKLFLGELHGFLVRRLFQFLGQVNVG